MEETTASQSRSDTQPDGQQPGTPRPGEAEKTYRVKHNKQARALTLEELLTAAEKGLDYDRIRPSYDYVKQLAARSGENDIARYLHAVSDSAAPGDAGDTADGQPGKATSDCEAAPPAMAESDADADEAAGAAPEDAG
ncbi:MAG: hypothetical protein P4M02_06310, partial [Clostridia bacterium]|nr:hypothetical protein [Clostridia bacterium]